MAGGLSAGRRSGTSRPQGAAPQLLIPNAEGVADVRPGPDAQVHPPHVELVLVVPRRPTGHPRPAPPHGQRQFFFRPRGALALAGHPRTRPASSGRRACPPAVCDIPHPTGDRTTTDYHHSTPGLPAIPVFPGVS